MKELIKRILKEEQESPVLNKKEILLFKYINDNKQNAGTKNEMVKFIQEMLRYFGMPINEARMYYEIYTANFRPDGDYENLTKENFKDYRQFKQRKVTKNTAYEYATAKMPFKGSNVEGQWEVNDNNEWYYVIKSYGWYPIFLFINDQWYRTLDTYSSSTRKQMSQVRPVFDSNLQSDVISVTKGEKLPVSQGAGLTQKGRDKVNKATGSNLKAPAPNPKTKVDAGRKASFCARMSGMPGPKRDEKGELTRKAASLKRWNCPGW